MRSIVFRGKRVDNGEWIYGDFVGRVMICDILEDTLNATGTYHGQTPYVGFVEVRPETVGQFTGLFDKNDRKIFEGDIVKFDSGMIRSVIFNEHYAEFEFDPQDPVENPDGACLCVDCDVCVKIGNIYDNPELLKASNGRGSRSKIIGLINDMPSHAFEPSYTIDKDGRINLRDISLVRKPID